MQRPDCRPGIDVGGTNTEAVPAGAVIVDGGIEFDGRDLSPRDTGAIARFPGEVGD